MTSVTDFDIGSLIWVKGEIDQALDQAATSLQQFAGQPLEAGQLRFSLTHLHQVTGAINMVGLDALGRFSEEIELAVQSVDRGERSLDGKAVAVLADAINAFKAYLDDLVNGRADASLALFPFFQRLRQFRGEVAREAELFYPDLNVGIPPLGTGVIVAPNELLGYLKDQRTRFQMGLVQWLRDHNPAGLQSMFHVLRNVARAQASSMGRGFWWSASALVEVVAYQGIDVDAEIRQLFTRLDMQLRRAAEGSPKVAERLFRDLLYLIAVSRVESPNIKAVRQAFQLLAYLPTGVLDLDRAAISARAQNAKTLLQAVKDAWSKYTSGNPDKRAACLDALDGLYGASAALGKPEFGHVVASISNAVSSQDKPLEDNQAMEVATALLLLENALNLFPEWPGEFAVQAGVMQDRLLAVANSEWSTLPSVDEVPLLDDATRRVQERQLQGQVAREIRTNLQHIEQTLDSYFRQQIGADELLDLNNDLKQIKGALSILDMAMAKEVLAHCATMIGSFSSESNLTSLQDHQDVAEGLSALGFYIDEYELGRDASAQVLQPVVARIRGLSAAEIAPQMPEANVLQSVESEIADQKSQAIQLLGALREAPENAEVKEQLVETLSSLQQNADLIADVQLGENSKAALQLLETDASAGGEELHEELHEAITGQDASPAEASVLDESTLLSDEAVDAELLEIYLEEAQEVLANVADQLQICQENAHDKEALTVIRRSYHTLKGSGRMVGLNNLGDVAWCVEQMMNDWLQAERSATPAMLHVLEEARAQFLGWVEQLQAHGTVRFDPTRLTSMAQLLRDEPDIPTAEDLQARLAGQMQGAVDAAVDEVPVSAVWQTEESDPLDELEELPQVFAEEIEAAEFNVPIDADAPDVAVELQPEGRDIEIGPVSISPVLFGIFAEEAQKHLATLKDGVAVVESSPQNGFDRNLLFAAHTLRGIAHTTGFRTLGDLGEGLEAWLADRTESKVQPDDCSIALFQTAVHHTELMVDQILALQWPEPAEDMIDALHHDLEGTTRSNAELLQASLDGHGTWTQVAGLDDENADEEIIEAEELHFELDLPEHGDHLDADIDDSLLPEIVITETSELDSGAVTLAEPVVQAADAQDFKFDLDSELPGELPMAELIESEEAEPEPVELEEELEFETEAVVEETAAVEPALELSIEDELVFELEAGLEGTQAAPVEEELVLEEGEPLADLAELELELEEEAFEAELGLSEEAVAAEELEEIVVVEENVPATAAFDEELVLELGDVASLEAEAIAADDELMLEEDLPDLLADSTADAEEAEFEMELHLDAEDEDESELVLHEPEVLIDTNLDSPESMLEEDTLVFVNEEMPVVPDFAAGPEPEQNRSDADAGVEMEISAESDLLAEEMTVDAVVPEPEANETSDDEGPLFVMEAEAESETVIEPELASAVEAAVVTPAPVATPAFVPMTAEMIGVLVGESNMPGIPAVPLTLLEQALAVKDDIDEQLLPIFIEEGQDLLPQVSANVRQWREKPDTATECSNHLKRLLHTLKGSARMAGAMRLGEATHHIETRLIHSLDHGGLDESLLEDLASDVDVLDLLFDSLLTGEVLAAPGEAAPMLAAEVEAPGSAKAEADAQATVGGLTQDVDPAKAQLRVRADIIDRLVNDSGEVAIARSRIEAEMIGLKRSLHDLTENVGRLRAQLREIEIQAESQMQSRLSIIQDEEEHFDPLEFDRFTRLQELTRFMAESVNDVATIQFNLLNNLGETEAALQQQGRMTKELQQQLMRIRMVPFSNISERLYRIVRQTGKELGKKVNLEFRGGRVEIDRSVLEKMTSPFEHMLRNSIDHGLETREERLAAGKSEVGEVRIEARQEGNELVLTLQDDGKGMDLERIRLKGVENGLLQADQAVTEDQLLQLIFAAGFSTAQSVTQISGRGIGMDVVRSEIVNLGGRIEVQTTKGHGSTFTIHLPLTMAVTHVVLVRVGERRYAIPSIMVEQVQELKLDPLGKLYEKQVLEWMGNLYPFSYMGRLVGDDRLAPETRRYNTLLLIKSGTQRIAVHVDELIKNLEVVVKNISPQLARIPGVSGATVLGNGDIVMILNPIQLMNIYTTRLQSMPAPEPGHAVVPALPVESGLTTAPVIMVVDDSLTVRKITGRLLAREGYQVMTAKDGVDALQQLQEMQPDVMLLDIEMPRMDGFELTRNIRGDAAMRDIPIIMISSRTADKHKNYAHDLGVNVFLGKPYQEDELLGHITHFCAQKRQKR